MGWVDTFGASGKWQFLFLLLPNWEPVGRHREKIKKITIYKCYKLFWEIGSRKVVTIGFLVVPFSDMHVKMPLSHERGERECTLFYQKSCAMEMAWEWNEGHRFPFPCKKKKKIQYTIYRWLRTLFQDASPTSLPISLPPPLFSFSSGAHITLTYCLVLYHCGTPSTFSGGIFLNLHFLFISLFYIPATVYSPSSPPSFEIESAEVIEASWKVLGSERDKRLVLLWGKFYWSTNL